MAEPAVTPPTTWGRSTVQTSCPLDCPDACSLAVTVERGRIVKIDGSRDAPSTDGYICGKVRRFDRRVYGDDRIMHPAVRRGAKGAGGFERVTWDEALDTIATRMREARDQFGAESILPFYYGGSNGLLTNELEDARLFRRLGASRLARTVCAAPTTAAATAMYGKMAGVAYEDYADARLIVVWGANPSASGIHLVAHIKRAQKNGAKLVVIDPRRIPLARQADLHLPVRPGTDLVVALAVLREIFETGRADRAFLDAHATGADELRRAASAWTIERAAAEAGIDPAALRQLARWYMDLSPAVIRCGWGQERNRNGGSSSLAIMALPAVAGKFGVRGGGYTMSNSAAWGVKSDDLIGVPAPPTRIISMNQLGRVLTDDTTPPIKVLFVYNCNPAATMPDQNRVRRGLERADLFTIVFDTTQTDSTKYADVILPATSYFEHYDISKGYGAYHFQLVQPAIEPVGESRSNHDVFRELGMRLGLTEGADDLGDASALLDTAEKLPDGLRAAVLGGGQGAGPADGRPIQFVDVFPKTSDQRAHLFPADLESAAGVYAYLPDPTTDRFPLALISPASAHTISSTLGEFRPGIAKVKIHPDDAQPRVIAEGDLVRIWNELGEVHCEASVTPELRAGVLALPKGLWLKSTLNGATGNALVPDSLSDIGAGACFNDARVQIELLARH